MEIQKWTPETGKNRYLSLLNYGWSGSGKTHFGGTAIPAGMKTLFLVPNEEELLTLDGMGIKEYEFFPIGDYSKMWDLYLVLRENKQGYQCVVLDGISEIQQAAKDKATASATPEMFIRGEKRVQLQDWGQVLEMMRHFLVPFIRLPMHKVVTCLAEVDIDPKDGSPRIYPFLQGSMQQLLPAYFSVVAFSAPVALPTGRTHYCLTTQVHPCLVTKTRIGTPRLYENPDITRFLKMLNGEEVKQTEIERRLQEMLTIAPTDKLKMR